MNERTRELWVQCVRKHTKDPMNWQDVADEFAELIIYKCIGISTKIDKNPFIPDGDQAKKIIREIKEHFGVE